MIELHESTVVFKGNTAEVHELWVNSETGENRTVKRPLILGTCQRCKEHCHGDYLEELIISNCCGAAVTFEGEMDC
jgi:hypothetical protein